MVMRLQELAHIGGIGILLSDNFPEFLFVGWARVISGFIKRGPVDDAAASAAGSADEATAAVKEGE